MEPDCPLVITTFLMLFFFAIKLDNVFKFEDLSLSSYLNSFSLIIKKL